MAAVLPNTKLGRLEWAEARISAWKAATTTIGLTLAECNALAAQITAARGAYDNAVKQKALAKDSTVTSDDQIGAMSTLAANAIKHIKAYAASSANPDAVFAAASVPPPASPGTMAPPGQPKDFTFSLNTNSGGLTLHWKCTNPSGMSGVVYNIRRAIGSGPFSSIALIGAKSFTDTTIPGGAASITYQVVGQHGSVVGPASNNSTVHFGTGGGMQVVESDASALPASTSLPADAKMAA